MKRLLLLALWLAPFIDSQTINARLGEDEIQCEDRYGFAKKEFAVTDKMSPLLSGDGTITRTYLYQGWRIRVGFLNQIAVREEYWKVTGPGRTLAIADFESSAILEGEKGAGAWQAQGTILSLNVPKMLQDRLRTILAGAVWIRSDGLATATLDPIQLHLCFESLEAVQHDVAIKEANAAKQRAAVPVF